VYRQLVGTLSKGYRQRVGLADTLLANPPVLILDEPTSGLDPSQIRETRGLIKELGQEHTILLSTHILSEVQLTCQNIIIIDRGAHHHERPGRGGGDGQSRGAAAQASEPRGLLHPPHGRGGSACVTVRPLPPGGGGLGWGGKNHHGVRDYSRVCPKETLCCQA